VYLNSPSSTHTWGVSNICHVKLCHFNFCNRKAPESICVSFLLWYFNFENCWILNYLFLLHVYRIFPCLCTVHLSCVVSSSSLKKKKRMIHPCCVLSGCVVIVRYHIQNLDNNLMMKCQILIVHVLSFRC